VSAALLAGLAAVGLVAFSVEAAIGFGATVLAAALGAQLVGLDTLLPAFVPINMCLSIWLLLRTRRQVAWRVLAVEAAPAVVVGAAIGLALAHVDARLLLQLVFAVLVVGMAALELGRLVGAPVVEDKPLPLWIARTILLVGGVAHGLFGTGGPMLVYVLRRRVPDKTAFRGTLAVIWLSLNTGLIVNFAALGLYAERTAWVAGTLALTVAPAFLLGSWLHKRLDARAFQRAVCVLLLVAGGLLAVRTGLQLRGTVFDY
jgi:uncharacterized membrane protein YfcA